MLPTNTQTGCVGEVEGVKFTINPVVDLTTPPPAEHQQQILLGIATKAVCTRCHTESAPYLYLKRCRGKYDLLCMHFDGSGCYASSPRTLCCYVDSDRVQCCQLAEYLVTAADGTSSVSPCSDHLGKCMGTSETHVVYPLDLD